MKGNELEPITVGNEDLTDLMELDIVAFQLAEAGAMGYHGGVFFVTSDKKVLLHLLSGTIRLYRFQQIHVNGESRKGIPASD